MAEKDKVGVSVVRPVFTSSARLNVGGASSRGLSLRTSVDAPQVQNPMHARGRASSARGRASSMQLQSLPGLEELLDISPITWWPWLRFRQQSDEQEYQELCLDRDLLIARQVMWCLLAVHVPVMLVDSLLFARQSRLLEGGESGGESTSAAELAMWWYLLGAVPFATPRVFDAAPLRLRKCWKGWFGLVLFVCLVGIFVRTGDLTAVSAKQERRMLRDTIDALWLRCANETTDAGGVAVASFDGWTSCAAAALGGGAQQLAGLGTMEAFNANTGGALMVVGCSFFGLVALTAATAAHLDHKHSLLLFVFSATALLVVQASYHVSTHGSVFVMMMAAGVLVCYTALRNDKTNRHSFLSLRAARDVANDLQVTLHGAKQQLRAFEVAAPDEKEAVQTVLEKAFTEQELMDMCTIEFKDIKMQRLIGSGAHGEVIRANLLGTPVVVKRMQRASINQQTLRSFVDEIKLMVKLRHPNIVQLIGTSFNTFCNICMVVEWVERGDLHEVLKLNKGHGLTWNDPLLKLAIDAARGMAYLHGNGVIHRDIKSPNLLVSSTFGCKVSDFGLSKRADLLNTVVGTSLWLPPEIINHQRYDEKADVWSFGVVLTEMATKKMPYKNLTESGKDPLHIMMAVANKGLRPEMPPEDDEGCPKKLRQLVADCLAQKPTARPSFVTILTRLQDDVRGELLGENFHEARPKMLQRTQGVQKRGLKKANSSAIQAFRTAQLATLAVSRKKGAAEARDSGSDDDGGGGGFQLKTRGMAGKS